MQRNQNERIREVRCYFIDSAKPVEVFFKSLEFKEIVLPYLYKKLVAFYQNKEQKTSSGITNEAVFFDVN